MYHVYMNTITRYGIRGLLFGTLALFVGCDVVPGEPLSMVQSGATLPACDPHLVGGNRKCTQSPNNDQPSSRVECATFPYAPDGTYQGDAPVSGCTLEFTARPGVTYTAECVASCDGT